MRPARFLIAAALALALLAGCSGDTTSPGGPGSTPGVGEAAPGATGSGDNGVSALPAKDIAAKAASALGGARSVKIKGEVTAGDKITLDLQVRGRDGRGTLIVGGQPVEIIRIGADIYLKADAAFWKRFAGGQGDTLASALGSRYLKVPTSDPDYGSLASYFDLVDSFAPPGPLDRGETTVINGVAVIALLNPDLDDGGTMYVATQGEPYPIRLEGPGVRGVVDFSDYNAAVEITAPAAHQFVDIEKLPQPADE